MNAPVFFLHRKEIFKCIVFTVEIAGDAPCQIKALRAMVPVVRKQEIQRNDLQDDECNKYEKPADE